MCGEMCRHERAVGEYFRKTQEKLSQSGVEGTRESMYLEPTGKHSTDLYRQLSGDTGLLPLPICP